MVNTQTLSNWVNLKSKLDVHKMFYSQLEPELWDSQRKCLICEMTRQRPYGPGFITKAHLRLFLSSLPFIFEVPVGSILDSTLDDQNYMTFPPIILLTRNENNTQQPNTQSN